MRHYRAHFGLSDTKPWTRIVRFQHDSFDPPSHEALICLAGNEVSDILIAEGADPLLYRYGDLELITEQEYSTREEVVTKPAARNFVLFESSFRYESAPNISHETINGVKTLCGRSVEQAATFEPEDRPDAEPDCRTCARVWKKRRVVTAVSGRLS